MQQAHTVIRAGIDWGSTSFRAYRFDKQRHIIEQTRDSSGLKSFAEHPAAADFEHVLYQQIGGWLQPDDRVLLSGMVTSRTGWVETPYLNCPVNLTTIVDQATPLMCNDIELLFLPGLCQRQPNPDVIRGEELQMLGAWSGSASETLILPGTHSKWAQLVDGQVTRFHTIATGELYDLLLNQSLLGAFATAQHAGMSQFLPSVEEGYSTDTLVQRFFDCRAGVLLDSLRPEDVAARLSGLLIGHELREGLQLFPESEKLTVIGDADLVRQYVAAGTHLSLEIEAFAQDASALGFEKLVAYND